MPSDEEFRRVAEDLRGLARSLARDFRAAADDVRKGANKAIRDERQRHHDLHHHARGQWPWGPYVGPPPPPYLHPRGRRNWQSKWGTPPPAPPAGAGTTATMPAPAPAPRPPKPKRVPPPLRHRRDGSTLIGGLALVFGLAWLAARIHLGSPSAEAVIAIALMLVGGAMVVTARTDWALSRKAWPALAGGVLVIAALGASPGFGAPADVGSYRLGSHTTRFTDWTQVPRTVRGGIGNTVIDLSALTAPPVDTALVIETRIGHTEVRVPDDVHTVIDAHVAVGSIRINGRGGDDGPGADVHEELSASAPGHTLTLDITSGPGQVEILQSATRPVPPAIGETPTVPPEPTVPSTEVGTR